MAGIVCHRLKCSPDFIKAKFPQGSETFSKTGTKMRFRLRWENSKGPVLYQNGDLSALGEGGTQMKELCFCGHYPGQQSPFFTASIVLHAAQDDGICSFPPQLEATSFGQSNLEVGKNLCNQEMKFEARPELNKRKSKYSFKVGHEHPLCLWVPPGDLLKGKTPGSIQRWADYIVGSISLDLFS